ncbi:MAG: bifunctional diaminohydroxyphosphoribosylaminopyrimidine deaminase/5-amino-6-(5-phosphoribosylamino)uracil reductase RibD [Ignavibacteriae bacterium]|nr:bifunctional diaminohydroxyphosphoribosylaminopyrimidine deaminase/5-amino-6-(5-phosphoribosylamino)uracil reductase RibD [Ignavibacteriota bacterium]
MAIDKQTDQYYVRRCFELARKGKGWVSPNPMVGCVIVKNGKIIAEGYHAKHGGAHAERVALRKAGTRAKGATLYVNLEPCAHHGHTPPCSDAIIEAKIRSVVFAMRDPNPWVLGGGMQKLRRAGIKVHAGVLDREAQQLNEKFVTFVATGMPFVGAKIAQTLDGKIADAWGSSQWITGEQAREYGHTLRTEYDAILVGANTIVRDNPRLTARLAKGRNPVRVVIDGKLSVPANTRVYTDRQARTIVMTSARAMKENSRKVQQLSRNGVEVIAAQNSYSLDAESILKILSRLGVASVLIEGGSNTLASFLKADLIQKIHCLIAPKVLEGGLNAWNLGTPRRLEKALNIKTTRVLALGSDTLIEGTLSSR